MGSQRVKHNLAAEQKQLQQAGEPEVGLRILSPKRELLGYTYSPVCGLPTHLGGMGFDFITSVPLLPSHCGFFLVFRTSVLVGSGLY